MPIRSPYLAFLSHCPPSPFIPNPNPRLKKKKKAAFDIMHILIFIFAPALPTVPSDGNFHGCLPPLPPEYSGGHPVLTTYVDCGHCRHPGVPGYCLLVLLLCKYSTCMNLMTILPLKYYNAFLFLILPLKIAIKQRFKRLHVHTAF